MIRAATVDDAPAIARLEVELFGVDAWTPQQVVDELTAPGRLASVIVEAEVVGYVVTMLTDDVLDLLRIGVHPDRRRRGLAGRLLTEALGRPADRVLLEVSEANLEARGFYAAHGFSEIDVRPRYYRDGADALVLHWLPSAGRTTPMTDEPLVLGIETSCDETGVGIVRGHTLLADAVASSVEEHARFGGVVPEVASRAHLEAMVPTIERACATAGIRLDDVDAIAVTSGPGLAGALLVGVAAAKALALGLGKPIYGVNHLAAHVAVDQLEHGPLPEPCLAMLV